jgi:hypothetical protein
MEKDLRFYLKKLSKFIPEKICKQTIKELNLIKEKNWNKHTFYSTKEKNFVSLSGNKELSVIESSKISTKQEIMNLIHSGLSIYFKDLNFNWCNGWSGFSSIRFNKYKKNKQMAEHCDHIHTLFDGEIKGIPILSVVGVLNENYSGGEFIMFQDSEIKFQSGDLLIFPSIFLYPHKIKPVKKGMRYSFVSWTW